MSDIKPWEETPDDGYWYKVLGASAASRTENAAPPTPPAASAGWALAETSYAGGETLELRVVAYNRGGLLVDLGDVRGFVPASQLVAFSRQMPEEQRMQALSDCIGSTLRLKVLELDRAHNRLILSERVANPPVSHADQVLASIEPQQTRKGVVRNVTDFGAFVDLGGVEGLIHVSELSWQYVKHPRDVIAPNQEVEVYVMEVNRETRRIACSLKRLTGNPWTQTAARLHPGDTIAGVVTSVVPFGAFVRVAEGVEGLVHVSELAEGAFLHPRDVVKEGQAVRVRVLDIDPNQQRLRLSLRLNGTPPKENRAADKTRDAGHTMPPPLDPGYWESLAESGM